MQFQRAKTQNIFRGHASGSPYKCIVTSQWGSFAPSRLIWKARIWVPVQACIVETVINGPWTISNLQACFQPYVYERVVALQVNEHLYDDEVIEKFQSA